MHIPIYSKSEIAYAVSEGNHSLQEFDEYLNELILDGCLDGPALGIAKKAADEGTKELSENQLFALGKGTEPYKLEHCSRCNTVVAISKGNEYPFFCDSCLSEFKES